MGDQLQFSPRCSDRGVRLDYIRSTDRINASSVCCCTREPTRTDVRAVWTKNRIYLFFKCCHCSHDVTAIRRGWNSSWDTPSFDKYFGPSTFSLKFDGQTTIRSNMRRLRVNETSAPKWYGRFQMIYNNFKSAGKLNDGV